MERTTRRTWLDVADVALSLGLLVVAVVSALGSRWAQTGLALLLALVWGGAVAARHRRTLRRAAAAGPVHAPAG